MFEVELLSFKQFLNLKEVYEVIRNVIIFKLIL